MPKKVRTSLMKFQIGKNGITQGVIESLDLALKGHKQIRISLLKSAVRDKKKTKEIALDLLKRIKFKCDYRIIGFTIVLIKNMKCAGS